MSVVIETTVGDITVDLYVDERPQTCRNFLKLCKIKYYNWNLFHSVQSNFIAQTGDPTGTGKGGESIDGVVLGEHAKYYEAERMPKIRHDRAGLVSMVNCGNNMLGSQFFITLAAELQSLDGNHCVFGEIVEGLEIILKFNETICDNDHRPYQDIRISHTVILEDPFEDPKGLIIPDKSPEPTKEALMSDRIGADEVIDDTSGMTTEEILEMQKEKEAKARATILEIVGDIPDADIAPPENVLFVCKLNPVTTDDDLEIIFSRFGKIVGCEVIRDKQTGDSLQYAFIEFAERKSCEDAYFKMDNVLIDDRRIHVDFSQSVAKMKWRGKGKGIKYFDNNEEKKEEYRKDNWEYYSENKYQGRQETKKENKKENHKIEHSEDVYKKSKDRRKDQRINRDNFENGREEDNREYRKPKHYKTHYYDYKEHNKKEKEREKESRSDNKYNSKKNRSSGHTRNKGNNTRSRSRSRSRIKSRSKVKNKKRESSSSRSRKYYK